MNQKLPTAGLSPGAGNVHKIGDISIEVPIAGDLVQIRHGNKIVFRLKVLGVHDAIIRLKTQDTRWHPLMQILAEGCTLRKKLNVSGFYPAIAPPSLHAEDFQPDAPFRSPLGIPEPFARNDEQFVEHITSLYGFFEQIDQLFNGTLLSLNDGRRGLHIGDLLLQKGNQALWRFRQGALRLFAEQAGLYALAEPQDPTQPALGAFQKAARSNLDVLRGWLLFQKYSIREPALIDQVVFAALKQGDWQTVLDLWQSRQCLCREQIQAERSYLDALGKRYDTQTVQTTALEAEWYFKESIRRKPGQSAALVNLAALLAESALLAYVETGTTDRVRLQRAQNFFQRAHEILDERQDEPGRVALAQCLLYEATCFSPEAQPEEPQWANDEIQQLRAALEPGPSESIRWDIALRNLARRDPGLVDWKKIERARDLLLTADTLAPLVALAEQWLGMHASEVFPGQGRIHAGTKYRLPPGQPAHPGGSVTASSNVPAEEHRATHSLSQKPGKKVPGHQTRIASQSATHGLRHALGTVAGKIAAAVIVTAIIAASASGVVLAHQPSPASHYQPSSPGDAQTHQPPAAGKITEFPVPTSESEPGLIAAGPDGNLWFTEPGGNRIGRITPAGSITEFAIPTPASEPTGITAGPDGNLWFTELHGNKIGRITPAGSITEFAIPTPASVLEGITTGPDDNLWFTELHGNKIGRITPSGSITEFQIPTALSDPEGIVTGPDDNLWFTELLGDKIGRITPAGSITEFAAPGARIGPDEITAGPDGNLWFTDNNAIGRITLTGIITEFTVPMSPDGPAGITQGPDGNLWFTGYYGNNIGYITPTGTLMQSPLQSTGIPAGITIGPDHNLWFTDWSGNNIGRITSEA